MSRKIIISVFKSKNEAFDTSNELKKLSKDGNVGFKINAGVALYKDSKGNVEVLKEKEKPLWGTVNSAAIGALIGLIAGPAGALAGASLGAVLGVVWDVFDGGIDQDVIQQFTASLDTNRAIIIIDADEDNELYVNEIISSNSGLIFRP